MAISFSPVFALAVATLGLFVMARLLPARLWMAEFLCLGIGAAAAAALLYRCHARPHDYAYFVLAYVPLGFCFFQFNNLGETSIRFRMIRECLERGGQIELKELRQIYDSKELMRLRMERLETSGNVAWKEDRMVLQSAVLRLISHVVSALRWLLALG